VASAPCSLLFPYTTLFRSEVTALIGPSGCGKSTFLRCLNRMNDVIPNCRVGGSIRIDGEEIYDPKVDPVILRQKVGMVFQKPNRSEEHTSELQSRENLVCR